MISSLFQCLCSTWTAVLVGVVGALYLYGKWENGYYRRRGVRSLPTRIPFFGHMMSVIFQREHLSDFIKRMYKAFPNDRYIGIRQFTKPLLMVTDLDIIKQITIKDFDHFQDHQSAIDEKQDPLFGNNLVGLKGQKWHDMRATLSPAFTSSKMRGMFEFLVECGDEMTTYFEQEMQKPLNREWTDDEIAAQAVIFFLAGFDTSSSLLSFAAHELAANPDVQQRLQDEVDEVAAKNNGKMTYANLHGMKYMDMVISETLRFWPIAMVLDRKCVKKYTLPPPNATSEKGLTLNVNDGIWIPVYTIHRDPQYYENPDKFDPERFSDENKGSINPLAYLPFGIGPRSCIASRFALMECKAIIFQILLKFNLVVTTKTHIPMKIKKSAFNFVPADGFWIGVKPRARK